MTTVFPSPYFLQIMLLMAFHTMGEPSRTDRYRVNRSLSEVKHLLDSMRSQLKYLDSISPNRRNEKTQVAFSARLSNKMVSSTAYEKVVFNEIVTNIGGAYNPKDGIFTAPRDGVYIFAWTVLTNPGKIFDTELVVDGKPQLFNAADANGGSYESSGCTGVLKLSKGDKVWIRKHNTLGNLLRGMWSSFSGWNLY